MTRVGNYPMELDGLEPSSHVLKERCSNPIEPKFQDIGGC